jgi:ATP-binding cassette subfamily B protein
MQTSLRDYGSLLAAYLGPQRARVATLAALLLAGIALQLANPQLLRYFIDSAQSPQADQRALLVAASLFILIALAAQGLSLGATYVSENLAWAATNELRSDLTAHCMSLDMAFHKGRTPGELIERIDGDVTALANFFSQFVIRILGNLVLMLGVLVVLLVQEWRIGLAMTALAAMLFVTLLGIQRITVRYWASARESSAALFGFIEERLSGTEDIRSNGGIDYTMARLYERSRERLHMERRASVIGASSWLTPLAFFAVANGLTYWLGYRFFHQGTLTLGSVYLLFFYTEALLRPVIQITREIEDLQKAGAGIVRIRELRAIQPTLVDGDRELPEGALGVEFVAVSFAYDDNDQRPAIEMTADHVLTNIRLSIRPGRVLGILGRTGSGKTTLTRLLFRLYDVSAGAIRLGGVDIRELRADSLRRRIGMVTQEVQLFHATLRENLTLFDSDIPDARILAVLEELELLAWYRTLPDGLDSVLAAGGGGLSAGEAQVLAFTRVFLRNPGLIILDEASSRLDPATEQLIERAVGRLLAGRTGIIIAHRLATVLRADDILILEDGQIVEYGEREILQANPGSRFAGLLRTGLDQVLA